MARRFHILPRQADAAAIRAAKKPMDEMIENVGVTTPLHPTMTMRWAINVLLEKIAAELEANETMDIFRSEAAALVRSFKHDLSIDADPYRYFNGASFKEDSKRLYSEEEISAVVGKVIAGMLERGEILDTRDPGQTP